ncbi:hypothetical protein KA078_01075 [Candidatus Woesebacteria bacterium]|nr:hypothetical protein [Candidatus Woesebacteria bacterium]
MNNRSYWVLLLFCVGTFLIGLGIAGVNYTQTTTRSTADSIASEPTKIDEIAMTFVKEGYIYIANYQGAAQKVFDLNQTEFTVPEKLLIKLSPNKKFLAYIGVSGGLDSAIKIVDIQQQKMIFQDVYGSANISDFSWSPDSNQIVAAVNLMHSQGNYDSSLYLIDPINQTAHKPLFPAENIAILRVDWVIPNNLYYARYSYGSKQNIAVVQYNFNTSVRNLRELAPFETKVYDISVLFADFIISEDTMKMVAFVSVISEKAKSPEISDRLLTLALPTMRIEKPLLTSLHLEKSRWYEEVIVGIEKEYGSPDSSVALIELSKSDEPVALLDMGPSGQFHAVKIVTENKKKLLIVWSEFDDQHRISAYDLENLIEARRKQNTVEPVWKVTEASSLDI